jgi:hypothetical protein
MVSWYPQSQSAHTKAKTFCFSAKFLAGRYKTLPPSFNIADTHYAHITMTDSENQAHCSDTDTNFVGVQLRVLANQHIR